MFFIENVNILNKKNMSLAIHRHPFHNIGAAIEDNAILRRVKNIVISPVGQFAIGFVFGAYVHKIYGPLTERILKVLGKTAVVAQDPFKTASFGEKILLTPLVCVLSSSTRRTHF